MAPKRVGSILLVPFLVHLVHANVYRADDGEWCRLPSSADQYRLVSSELEAAPGSNVPPDTLIEQPCAEGHGSRGFQNSTCVNGRWSAANPQCLKMCEPIFKQYVEAICTYDGVQVPCSEQAIHGTVAGCRNSASRTTRVCTDGEWSQGSLDCRGACGVAIGGDSRADQVRFPWHAAVYKKSGKSRRYICGGSIVSPTLILTAAHCVEYPTRPDWYSVGVGRTRYKPDDVSDAHGQDGAVERVTVSPYYNGVDNLFAADVALLVLAAPLAMDAHVAPVCVPADGRSEEPLGVVGTVPHWSRADDGEINDELSYAEYPVVDYQRCLARMPNDFKKYLTFDKMCAGFTNGTDLCIGAGGGGLALKSTSTGQALYTVQGVASVGLSKGLGCDNTVYSIFTNLQKHLGWLHKEMAKYDQ